MVFITSAPEPVVKRSIEPLVEEELAQSFVDVTLASFAEKNQ